MTYEQTIARRDEIERQMKIAGDALKKYPRYPNGLTVEEFRISDVYRAEKRAYDQLFAALRDINQKLTRDFKTEMAVERKMRQAAREADLVARNGQ